MELFHRNLALPVDPISGGKPIATFKDALPIARAAQKRIVMIEQLPLGF